MCEIIGHYARILGYETYYEEAGRGQAVLCLPMAGASGSQYHHLLSTCADGKFRFIALDLPGRGKSLPDMKTLRPIDDGERYLAFIWAVVETLHLTPVILLGTAMNATAVTILANRHPQAVCAVIACNGGVVPKAANDPEYSSMLNHPSVNLSDFKETHIPGLCGGDIPRERLNMCIWHGAKTQVADTAAADVAVFSQLRYEGNLEHVTMPYLLLNGGEDVTVSPAVKRQLEGLPLCKSVAIPGGGHYLTMEKPDEVAREVTEFLNGLKNQPYNTETVKRGGDDNGTIPKM